jgi:DNA (cytosine-5)-methyltransferase 1
MKPTVGSLFSGIGGFDLGLERAGWETRWQVENDAFCNRILKRHWPEVKRYGDIRTIEPERLERVDMLCGGFPCQDLSVAGKGKGLAGERSGLWYEYLRLVRALRPAWVFIENVPGLLSSNKGKDMGIVLGDLAQCGYGVAWRILDSQYFGVPQRRRRVFIVGSLGRICPPEVLFESEGGEGDTKAGSGAGQGFASSVTRSDYVANPLQGHHHRRNHEASYVISYPPTSKGQRYETDGNYVIQDARGHDKAQNGLGIQQGGPVYSLDGISQHAVTIPVGPSPDADRVRTPTGVPRGLDSPRYRALGNAVTVPVIEWIGRRILDSGGFEEEL